MRAIIVGTNHGQLRSGKPTGAYITEIAHAWAVFEKAGWEVEFASPAGGTVPLDGDVELEDDDSRRFLQRFCVGRELRDTRLLSFVKPAEVLFFAGGHGAMWDFPDVNHNPPPCRVSSSVVAAVCHGVAIFAHESLHHLELSCFTDVEERLAGTVQEVPFSLETRLLEQGCIVRKAAPWNECVTMWGRCITGQNPASARGVALTALSLANRLAYSP